MAACPDKVIVREWGINTSHADPRSISLIFDGENTYIASDPSVKHPLMRQWKQLGRIDAIEMRYWPQENIMGFWCLGDSFNRHELLKKFKKAYKVGNIEELKLCDFKRIFGSQNFQHIPTEKPKPSDELWQLIDIENVDLIFVENGTDGDYVVRCKFDELDDKVEIASNQGAWVMHMMSPMGKKLMIDHDMKLRAERHIYFIQSQRAWINKHGSIDPALYHLLMYEE